MVIAGLIILAIFITYIIFSLEEFPRKNEGKVLAIMFGIGVMLIVFDFAAKKDIETIDIVYFSNEIPQGRNVYFETKNDILYERLDDEVGYSNNIYKIEKWVASSKQKIVMTKKRYIVVKDIVPVDTETLNVELKYAAVAQLVEQ